MHMSNFMLELKYMHLYMKHIFIYFYINLSPQV